MKDEPKLVGDPDRPLGKHGADGCCWNGESDRSETQWNGGEYYRAPVSTIGKIGTHDFELLIHGDYMMERIVFERDERLFAWHFCGPSKGGATITPRPDGKTEVIGWIAK